MPNTVTNPGVPKGIIHRRTGNGQVVVYVPEQDTDARRAKALRLAIQDLVSGDELIIGPGNYIGGVGSGLAAEIFLPTNCTIRGAGSATRFGLNNTVSKFNMADGCSFSDINFIQDSPIVQMFKFGNGAMNCCFRNLHFENPVDQTNRIQDVWVFSATSGVKQIWIYDCTVFAKEHALTTNNSDGPNTVNLYNCEVTVGNTGLATSSEGIRMTGPQGVANIFGGIWHADEAGFETTRALYVNNNGTIYAYGVKLSSFDASGVHWDAQAQSNGHIFMYGCSYDVERLSGASNSIVADGPTIIRSLDTVTTTETYKGELVLDVTDGKAYIDDGVSFTAMPFSIGSTSITVSATGEIAVDPAFDFTWSGKHTWSSITPDTVDQQISGNLGVSGFAVFGDSPYDPSEPNVLKAQRTQDVLLSTALPNAVLGRLVVGSGSDTIISPMGGLFVITDPASNYGVSLFMVGLVGRVEFQHTGGVHQNMSCIRTEVFGNLSTANTLNFMLFDGSDALDFKNESIANLFGVRIPQLGEGTSANWSSWYGGSGNHRMGKDNDQILLGTAQDAGMWFDGTNLIIDPKLVGTGGLEVRGDVTIPSDKFIAKGSSLFGSAPDDGTPGLLRAKDESDVPMLAVAPALLFQRIAGLGSNGFSALSAVDFQVEDFAGNIGFLGITAARYLVTIDHTVGTHGTVSGLISELNFTNGSAGTSTDVRLVEGRFSNQGSEVITTLTGLYMPAMVDGITNWSAFFQQGDTRLGKDNDKTFFGTAQDASYKYDGIDFVVDPAEVGSGRLKNVRGESLSVSTQAVITSSQIAYQLDNVQMNRLASSVAIGIRGFDASIAHNNEQHIIINVGAFDIVLNNQHNSASATNRIITNTGADVTLQPDGIATIVYDESTQRWRQIT